jgi:hypothetical protein
VKAVDTTAKLLDEASLVWASTVPEEEHVTPQMVKELSQEGTDLLLLDVLEMELEVKVRSLELRADRYGRNG